MKAGQNALDLIRHYESLHDGDLTTIGLQPKKCPAGIWTIGWGHALYYEGQPVRNFSLIEKYFPQYLTIDVIKADEILLNDLNAVEKRIISNIRNVSQDQFDALVSYFFNVGFSNTMIQLVNNQASDAEIDQWFTGHYITADGKYLPGLKARRMSESLLFRTGELRFYNSYEL